LADACGIGCTPKQRRSRTASCLDSHLKSKHDSMQDPDDEPRHSNDTWEESKQGSDRSSSCESSPSVQKYHRESREQPPCVKRDRVVVGKSKVIAGLEHAEGTVWQAPTKSPDSDEWNVVVFFSQAQYDTWKPATKKQVLEKYADNFVVNHKNHNDNGIVIPFQEDELLQVMVDNNNKRATFPFDKVPVHNMAMGLTSN